MIILRKCGMLIYHHSSWRSPAHIDKRFYRVKIIIRPLPTTLITWKSPSMMSPVLDSIKSRGRVPRKQKLPLTVAVIGVNLSFAVKVEIIGISESMTNKNRLFKFWRISDNSTSFDSSILL